MAKVYEGKQASEAVRSIFDALSELDMPEGFTRWMVTAHSDDLLLVANCLITTVRLRWMAAPVPSKVAGGPNAS